ncbi:twin-arginine translocase subunit TatC [Falsigemmobacter faecalis]|uniref:Sec-independent protein translocase protein TatC n=1 Tax=Falsigemmobacter faecalis TaxID=2488730 RepID=A0A3P3DLP1_9RHOB|nr:twin-arginine translocase subunit TatC [Falsigemmobacter faecalis]RRH75103.1 twin-arginine translocase subunit TatC [Falsigemmobacter faecalis]
MSTDDIDDSAAPLIEHLSELRNRLIWSVVAFLIGMMICFAVWNPVFNFLTQPICNALADRGQNCGLFLIKVQEGFFVAVRIAVLGGFALSFPFIAFQLWRFVAPGLYRQEKGALLPFLISSPIMFFLGAAFAYYVVLPIAFSFFLSFQQGGFGPGEIEGAGNELASIGFQGSVEEYLSLTMKFIAAFGICFQLPVLLTLLGKAGIVTSEGLGSVRKYAIVVILIVAALVTPPDMMSQLILFAAIYPLYEVSIFLIRRIERKREAKLRAEGLWVDDEDDEDDSEGPART